MRVMTRKRYIKLLMGKLDLSRNEARDRVARWQATTKQLDDFNHDAKKRGEKTVLWDTSYKAAYDRDVWCYIYVQKSILELILEEKFKSWKTSR